MKRLIIIRHAESDWQQGDETDFERSLNERGMAEASVKGVVLIKKQILPDLIISSPAKRAITTAKIIADKMAFKIEQINEDQRIYEANTSDLLNVIAGIDDHHSTVLLFGHNPGVTSFCQLLSISNSFINMQPCGVCCLDLDVERWGDVHDGSGKVVFVEI
ncbi:MAG: hypothetical protein HON94_16865 [Methylococcales bacterium]|nr:hypothetical protein [Methylococcales bacterium]MBT7410128.1 hypothetical protein [Methylococcales bacterium]